VFLIETFFGKNLYAVDACRHEEFDSNKASLAYSSAITNSPTLKGAPHGLFLATRATFQTASISLVRIKPTASLVVPFPAPQVCARSKTDRKRRAVPAA